MAKYIIVARAGNVIGRGKSIPWNIPEDRRFFRDTTTGNGNNGTIGGWITCETLGKPLYRRVNVALTSDPDYELEGFIVCETMLQAIELLESKGIRDIFFIGGEGVYQEALGIADGMYITEVNGTYEGDRFFPDFDETKWREIEPIPLNDQAHVRRLERI